MSTDKSTQDPPQVKQGPLGDMRPEQTHNDPRANPGQPVAPVEERETVGTVKPSDYPEKDRSGSDPTGAS